jgi:NAD(P)-dependent dehydrogenase (short-subunit alcohol dehydrogenase family)
MTLSAQQLFAGRTALVTGAGRGIGQQIAVQLTEAGVARVALVARSGDQLAETARLVTEAGGRPLIVSADLGDRDERAAVVATVSGEYGTVDILVNDAAIPDPMGPTATVDPVAWAHAAELNLVAPVDLTLALRVHGQGPQGGHAAHPCRVGSGTATHLRTGGTGQIWHVDKTL